MNYNNWTTTNGNLQHEWQLKPTPKDWKLFKYAQNNQNNPELRNTVMADSSKMKLQVQNNSWNVEWLMIAKLIAVEGSHLLPVSKISKIFRKWLLQ